jgi:hypothetical protein
MHRYGPLIRIYRRINVNPTIQRVGLLIERNERPPSLTYRVR